ncbi:MAG: glycine--tRNA ligase subunit alpha [Caldisericia bacterium]|jgi:glycyl-tRNA synthetase alpha chain|nr:glycine--tRNA ligase subunit alpha [Caldisericia bacterium]
MTFQDIITELRIFWSKENCVVAEAFDIEVGAGTMSPLTFFGVLGKNPYRVAYVQPSRRPQDGRYGDNPNRLYKHHQFQVILKPPPNNIIEIYLNSLKSLGIKEEDHDIRFVEDNWESPTLGAWGVGWEVWCDGMEITQFTYFQQAGGIDLEPISAEITYGLERIALFLQKKESIFEINWNQTIKYKDLRLLEEREMCVYSFEEANTEMLREIFDSFEKEAHELLDKNLILPSYEYCLKLSHIFNILDARGSIGLTERNQYITRIRNIANNCAKLFLKERNG